MQEPTRYLNLRERSFVTRSVVLAFACGLLISAVTSGGLVSERLSAGRLRNAVLIDLVVLCIAIVALVVTARRFNVSFIDVAEDGSVRVVTRLRSAAVLVPQITGASCGIVLVHMILKKSGAGSLLWMRECPAQFMNDAVAVFGTLAAVWACASRRLRMDMLAATLCALLVYGATRQHWHVDRAPFVFEWSIQQIVVARVIAVATGLLAFRRFGSIPAAPRTRA